MSDTAEREELEHIEPPNQLEQQVEQILAVYDKLVPQRYQAGVMSDYRCPGICFNTNPVIQAFGAFVEINRHSRYFSFEQLREADIAFGNLLERMATTEVPLDLISREELGDAVEAFCYHQISLYRGGIRQPTRNSDSPRRTLKPLDYIADSSMASFYSELSNLLHVTGGSFSISTTDMLDKSIRPEGRHPMLLLKLNTATGIAGVDMPPLYCFAFTPQSGTPALVAGPVIEEGEGSLFSAFASAVAHLVTRVRIATQVARDRQAGYIDDPEQGGTVNPR